MNAESTLNVNKKIYNFCFSQSLSTSAKVQNFSFRKMNDLLVIGAGHLGARVAVLWKNKFPEASIFLKTRTNNPERSQKWKALGYTPVACDTDSLIPKCQFVVYSVPPTSG